MTYYTTIELPVKVEFTAHAATSGARDKYGAPLEPDEPAELVIESVSHNDKAIELSPEVLSLLESELWENLPTDEDDYPTGN